jgi:serine/threonine protein kinase
MGDCPGRPELEEFLIDRLPSDSERRVLAHLEGCPACQQVLEHLTAGPVGDPRRTPAEADGKGPRPLPTRIGQYTVIRELGHGGMGVVYLAEQAGLRRPVALKVIRHGISATDEEVARFRDEAEAVALLQHPNVVQIHEVGGQDGVYYLALEYVDGGSLDRRLAGTPQDPTAAAQIVETLARAIHHAHRRGILHRDLKPANILMSGESAVPKITDFGLAKRVESGDARTRSGLVLGTPSYIAPEQASGRPEEVTHAVDIYGLGAILYELLTGRPPFKGATALSTLEQVASQEPVPPSRFHRQIPRDLETICLKCLEKPPGRRYASAEGLADDLHRFLSGRPIVARPIGAWGGPGSGPGAGLMRPAWRRPSSPSPPWGWWGSSGNGGRRWPGATPPVGSRTGRAWWRRRRPCRCTTARPPVGSWTRRPRSSASGNGTTSAASSTERPASSPGTRGRSSAWPSARTEAGSPLSPETGRCACGRRRPGARSP